jgi:16S rRNA C967 or C1407 C5-methylase (RsmB/RsmF family)
VSKDSNAAGRLRKLQRSILRRAFDLLRPGGTLVYSTCTYAPEENEAVVNGVLAEGQAELLPITLPLPHSQGLISWEEMDFSSEMLKTIRVYPHQVNSWGFFIAHLRKRV